MRRLSRRFCEVALNQSVSALPLGRRRESELPYRGILARFGKGTVLAALIVLFFVLMARIDYVVNSRLYDFGLVFSYDWANMYWLAFQGIFWVFSAMVAFIYWFGSRKTFCDKKVTAALFISINVLALGGLQDILYFVLWDGGLPANNVVWWWVPWAGVFGTWNSLMQVAFTVLAMGISLLTWALALRQKKKVCEYPL